MTQACEQVPGEGEEKLGRRSEPTRAKTRIRRAKIAIYPVPSCSLPTPNYFFALIRLTVGAVLTMSVLEREMGLAGSIGGKFTSLQARGEGRRDCDIKGQGCSSEILKRNPKRYQILFCGCGLKYFSPLRDTNSKTTHYVLSHFVRLSTLKGTAKASAVDLLMLNTLRGTKTAFQKGKTSTPVLITW